MKKMFTEKKIEEISEDQARGVVQNESTTLYKHVFTYDSKEFVLISKSKTPLKHLSELTSLKDVVKMTYRGHLVVHYDYSVSYGIYIGYMTHEVVDNIPLGQLNIYLPKWPEVATTSITDVVTIF